MNKKSIYLKYREERDYAKYLKKIKKNTWEIKKVARVRLERVDLNALMKPKPCVRVSLPIKYFNNIRSTMSNNNDEKELQTPKNITGQRNSHAVRPITPATNLRMVRHQVVAVQHDTTAGTAAIKNTPIKPNLLLEILTLPARDPQKQSKKIETYTPTNAVNMTEKANVMPFQGNEQISIKRKPTKNNYRLASRELNSGSSKEVGINIPTDIFDTSSKANVIPFQGDDNINMNYPYKPQKLDTAEKANVMPFQGNKQISIKRKPTKNNYRLASRELNSGSSKEVATNIPTDIIDTSSKANVIPFQGDDNINMNYPYKPQKLDTAEKANVMPFQGNKQISIKRKPTKNNYRLASRELNSGSSKEVATNIPTDIIDTSSKANVIPFQGDDNINMNYPYKPQKIDTAEKPKVTLFQGDDNINMNYPYKPQKIDTAEKANVMPFQGNEQISVKRKSKKNNYRLPSRELKSGSSKEVGINIPTDIIDTSSKANVIPFQGDDNINMNYPYKPQKIDTAEKPKVTLFQGDDNINMNYPYKPQKIDTAEKAKVMPFQGDDKINMNYPYKPQKIDTAEKAKVTPFQGDDNINMNYPYKPQKIDTAEKAKVMPFQGDDNINLNYPYKQQKIDTAEKANVMPFQGDDNINMNYPYKPQKTDTAEKAKVTPFQSDDNKNMNYPYKSQKIDTAQKAKVTPFQDDDKINMNYPYKPQKTDTAEKAKVTLFQGDDNKNMNYPYKSQKIDTAEKAKVTPFQGDDNINMNARNPCNARKIETDEKAKVMPNRIGHRKISFTNSKEIGTNTSTDKIDIGGMSYEHISIKHKLPVPVAPTKENYGIAHTKVSSVNSKTVGTNTITDIINRAAKANEKMANVQVNSANEVKRCFKALVITSTQTDKIRMVNEKELQILDIVTKSGVTNDELVDALESFKKVKELSKYNVTEVIDLDGPADDNGAKLLELARFHSEENKKAIYENNGRGSKSTSTKSATTPINLEQQKNLEMCYKLMNSMNYEQLKNIMDSQNKSNNKENSYKKRKTIESGDNYDEANMGMEIDVPGIQTITTQPVTATNKLRNLTTQQRQMQPIIAQKQNNESNMIEIHSSPIQQMIRQDANLELLHQQRMQQQQYLQELKLKNMLAKPKHLQQEQTPQLKNPQTQHPHSKSPQIREAYSKSPQFQQPYSKGPQIREQYSKSPQFQQPYSKSPQIREQYSKTPQFQQSHSKSSQPEPYSKSPQIQQLHSERPHDLQPLSQPIELQDQLQHPLDRRIQKRDEQRAALPQQQYGYESSSNSYPPTNTTYVQVPQEINSTQQPQFPFYPGDPRIQTLQSQMSQVMPRGPRLISTYEANLQTSGAPYPYQNNCYTNQQYW